MQPSRTEAFDAVVLLAFSLFAVLAAQPAQCASTEQETMRRLAQLRAIPADSTPEQLRQHNEQMDDAWQFYHAHRDEALPVLRRELAAELRKPKPAQLLLLDVASFFYLDGGSR